MKECKNCNIELEDEHFYCPNCGQPLTKKASEIESMLRSKKKEEEKPKIPLRESEAFLTKIKKYFGVCLSLFVAFAPFFVVGFSFNIIWYLMIVVVLFFLMTLLVTECKTTEDRQYINYMLVLFIVIGFLMFLWGPLNSNY